MSLKSDDVSARTRALRAKKEIGEAGIDIHEKVINLKQVLAGRNYNQLITKMQFN